MVFTGNKASVVSLVNVTILFIVSCIILVIIFTLNDSDEVTTALLIYGKKACYEFNIFRARSHIKCI